jgi:CBS domain containing-hemolysin-like protein
MVILVDADICRHPRIALQDVLTLGTDQRLDHETLDHILLSGFSRIPVHEPGQKDNFVGMLLVKKVSCTLIILNTARSLFTADSCLL